ncbi:Ig-like domain-containing protein [Ottowia thiooxydans]|uniref:Uncharacterized protein n=1 Tax=Ottowia thiooxydans TaxID=219182 RepID=A0ABV2Q6X6_9BURK
MNIQQCTRAWKYLSNFGNSVLAWSLRSLLLLPLMACIPALAQTYSHSVYLDLDNNAASGCSVTTAAGVVAGMEARVTAVVAGSPPLVTSVIRETCDGAAFGDPQAQSSSYPVAQAGGVGGADAIEIMTSLASLPIQGVARLMIASTSPSGADTASVSNVSMQSVAASPAPVPLWGWPALLLLTGLVTWMTRRHAARFAPVALILFATTLVWAATLNADGNVSDWAGRSPATTDPANDATSGEAAIDLTAVFAQVEGGNLFVRADVRNASNLRPSAASQSVSVTEGGSVVVILSGNDPEGAPLTFTISASPALGTLGSITPINATSASVTYTGGPGQSGADSFSFTASDGISVSDAAAVAVTVNPENRPPLHTVPGPQTVINVEQLVFSTANANAVSVADVDAGSGLLQMTLSTGASTNGTLSMANPGGALTTLTGNGSFQVVATGTLAALNAALNGPLGSLTYTPPEGFVGSQTITLTTSDQGNSGDGGPKTDTDTIAVQVMVGPRIASSPVDLALSLSMGGQGTVSFSAQNAGDMPLHYSLSDTGMGQIQLYSALAGNVASGFRSTQYLDPANAGSPGQYSSDDFTLTDTVKLKSLVAEGFVSNAAALNATSTGLTWMIFADSGGNPAGNPQTSPGAAIWSYSALPSDPGVSTTGNTIKLDLIASGNDLTLSPGRYWLVVYSKSPYVNRWVWFASNTGDLVFRAITPGTAGTGTWSAVSGFAGLAMQITGLVNCGAPWIGTGTPTTGTLAPTASATIQVPINAGALILGSHTAYACVSSNDPTAPVVAKRINLTVTP